MSREVALGSELSAQSPEESNGTATGPTGGSFAAKTAAVNAVAVSARAVGFLVPFAIAAWFGATGETDALFFAYALTLFVSNVFAPVAESLSVPFIAQRRSRGDNPAPFVTTLALVSVTAAIAASILLGSISLFLLPYVTSFSPEELRLASRLIVLAAPLVPLTALSGVFAGALNADGRFLLPAGSPFVRAAVNLLAIAALKSSLGVSSVIVGYVAGEAVRALLLGSSCFILRLAVVRLKHQRVSRDVAEFLRVGGFQAVGMLSIGFVPLIDRAMASWLAPGSVTLLEYADRLYQIPVVLIGTGIVVTALSRWSALLHTKGRDTLRSDVGVITRRTALLAVAVSLAFAMAVPLTVRIVYPTALSAEERSIVIATVLAFTIGVAPFVVGQLYNRALLALKLTRFLFGVTVVANVLNIFFNLVLMRLLGVPGLAMSSSATAIGVVFVLRHRFNTETKKKMTVESDLIETAPEGA